MNEAIQTLQSTIPEIVCCLRQNREGEAYSALTGVLPTIHEVMISFVNIIPALNRMGVELSAEVITRQLHNVADGCELRDNILLADTLEYEIMESLQIYDEILEQMN